MIKKLFNHFLTLLSVLMFVLAIYILVFGTISQKQNKLLTIFGYGFSVVPTDSMEAGEPDSIKAGSLVLSKKVPFEEINERDVIIFQSEGILKVHRVTKKDETGLTTEGDNPNASEDPLPTTSENYQAKVIKAFYFFGMGKHIPGVQLIALFILMVFLFVLLLVQIFKIIKLNHQHNLKEIEESAENNPKFEPKTKAEVEEELENQELFQNKKQWKKHFKLKKKSKDEQDH